MAGKSAAPSPPSGSVELRNRALHNILFWSAASALMSGGISAFRNTRLNNVLDTNSLSRQVDHMGYLDDPYAATIPLVSYKDKKKKKVAEACLKEASTDDLESFVNVFLEKQAQFPEAVSNTISSIQMAPETVAKYTNLAKTLLRGTAGYFGGRLLGNLGADLAAVDDRKKRQLGAAGAIAGTGFMLSPELKGLFNKEVVPALSNIKIDT